MIEIAVKNLSSVVSGAEMGSVLPAFQEQVSRDFAPVYGIDCKLHLFDRGASVPAGFWQLNVFDDADGAGYLGYHDSTAKGLPLGKVFAKTTKDYGGLWTVTFSHELLEMLADPGINITALDENNERAYAYEVCDSIEADDLGYKIHDVALSDFVLPSFFEPYTELGASHKRSFCGHVTKPFELAPGGYLAFLNLATREWESVDMMRSPDHAGKGSRFARRQMPTTQRRMSTAE